jgi:hypothetical protein
LKYVIRSIWLLSLISLFTDTASEMLYPIMPIYLKSIGFSVVLIGILEGVAEAVAGLSKGYFGKRSDDSGKRVPFAPLGYAFSVVSKPMMAFFIYRTWIFFAPTIDRFGKGIRTTYSAFQSIFTMRASSIGGIIWFYFGASATFIISGVATLLIIIYFLEFVKDPGTNQQQGTKHFYV